MHLAATYEGIVPDRSFAKLDEDIFDYPIKKFASYLSLLVVMRSLFSEPPAFWGRVRSSKPPWFEAPSEGLHELRSAGPGSGC